MKSNKIHWTELAVAGLVGSLLLSFLALLVYSYTYLQVRIPACLTATQPFEKGEVFRRLDPITHREKYEVHAVARMWQFEPSTIYVKAKAKVEFYLSSADVNHGFHIMGTNVNLTAVPGALNYASISFEHPGEYKILCHEYCGIGHQNMMGKIIVVPEGVKEDLEQYQKSQEAALLQSGQRLEGAELGKKIFGERACAACHSVDGNLGTGPTLKGVFGREEKLESGETIIVDEAYLRESILSPNVKVVKGYQPVMPPVPMTPAETDALVTYIKSLKR